MKDTYTTMKNYLADCRRFGWTASLCGFIAYLRQEKEGLRELWRGEST